MLGIDVKLVDPKLTIVILSHCVAETRGRDEGGMFLTTRNLKDGDVVGTKAGQVVQGLSRRHLLPKTQLAMTI